MCYNFFVRLENGAQMLPWITEQSCQKAQCFDHLILVGERELFELNLKNEVNQ